MTVKKRKVFFVILASGILTVSLIVVSCIGISSVYKVRSFSIEYYSEFIQPPSFYEKTHLGKIDTASEARKAAKTVFREVYADYSIAKTPPYIVSYDSQNDVWLVQAGMYCIPTWGAHLIINASDGEILGLWNYKF